MTRSINFFTDEDNLSNNEALDPWRKLASDWLFNFNSARTRDNYRRAVLFFFRFVDLHPEVVSQSDVLHFRYQMEKEAYSETTITSVWQQYRLSLRWQYIEGFEPITLPMASSAKPSILMAKPPSLNRNRICVYSMSWIGVRARASGVSTPES